MVEGRIAEGTQRRKMPHAQMRCGEVSGGATAAFECRLEYQGRLRTNLWC